MDDEKLIFLVSQYTELYDPADKNYCNNQQKDNCWEEIANGMGDGIEVKDVKKRWTALRHMYRRAMNKKKLKSGKAAQKISKWRLEEEMSFLQLYIDEETANLSVTDSIEDDEDVAGPSPSSVTDSESISTPTPKKINRNQSHSVAYVFENYLKNKSDKANNDEPLEHFFLSMAKTVNTFPPQLQTLVKGQVFNIINDAEYNLQTSANQPVYDKSRVLNKYK